MTESAVTNSTCLIALERIGQLDVLARAFANVSAPPAVVEEFGTTIPWLTVRSVSDLRLVTALKTQLDDGEAHAIALAMELGDVVIVLDDKKARRVARYAGLTVIGTLGVLLRAKQRGVLPAVRPVLTALRDAGFRMTAALGDEALRLAGEDPGR